MAEPALRSVAQAVADGAELDWGRAESGVSEEDRSAIRALRIVSSLAAVHRSLRESLGAVTAGPADATVELGGRWGRLEILERLGAGSYGEVFRAYDPLLERQVALKVLHEAYRPIRPGEPSPVEEARLLARVRHPGVATVYGADEHRGRVGFWMELVEGRDLGRIVAEHGLFGARESALIACELGTALAAVHTQGIVHRDVKAQNVLREAGGRIVLTDFGVGIDLTRPEHLSGLAGTPYYLAPEVLAGEPADLQSDIYALGVLLFHLVTGRFPVEGRSVDEIRRAHEAGERRWLRDLRPDLSARFVEAVERALAADPVERFASMGALERAFQTLLSDGERTARPKGTGRRLLAAAGALVVVLVLALGVVLGPPLGSGDKAQDLYDRALELHSEQKIEPAIELLEAAISTEPGFALAHAKLATYLGGVGRFAEALEHSARAYRSRERADVGERAYVAAIYHLDRLQYREALGELRLLAELQPEEPDIHLQLAHVHRNLSEQEQAIEALRRAWDLDPENALYPGFLAILLAEAGRSEAALEVISAARRRVADPHGYLYWGEGLARFVANDISGAEQAFESLHSGGGIYATYGRQGLAQTYVVSGRIHKAIRLLQAGAPERGYERNDARRLYRLARLHAMRGEAGAAERALEEIEEMSVLPIFLKQLREAAVLYAELERTERARAILERIEGLPAEDRSGLSRGAAAEIRGHLLAAEGEPDAALASLQEALRHWQDPFTLRSFALYWLGRGDCQEALPYLERIVAEKGHFLQTWFAVTWVEAKRELVQCQTPRG